MRPYSRQTACNLRLVINQHITTHPRFVFSQNYALCPLKAQMPLHPHEFFCHAIAIGTDGRGANSHLITLTNQPIKRIKRALNRRQISKKIRLAINFIQFIFLSEANRLPNKNDGAVQSVATTRQIFVAKQDSHLAQNPPKHRLDQSIFAFSFLTSNTLNLVP